MEMGLCVEKRDFIRDLKGLLEEASELDSEDYDAWNENVVDLLEESIEDSGPIVDKFVDLEVQKRNGEVNFNITLSEKKEFLNKILYSLDDDISTGGFLALLGIVAGAVVVAATLTTPRRIFIIHGREKNLLNDVKEYIIKTTGIQPAILSEQANGGKTIIEKLQGTLT